MSPIFPPDLCFQVSVLIIHCHCLSILAIYFPLCYCLTQDSFQANPKRPIMLLWGLSSPFKSIFGDLNDKQKSIRTSTCCTFCVYIENKVIQVNCRLNASSSYTFTIFAIKVRVFKPEICLSKTCFLGNWNGHPPFLRITWAKYFYKVWNSKSHVQFISPALSH